MKKVALRAFVFVLLCYGAAAATLALMQRSLLYHGEPSSMSPAQAGAAAAQNLYFSNEGERVQYWWIAPQAGQPILVYFHGNAGSLASRAGSINAFAQQGFGVAIMSYRGFGESTGHPSERAIYADADALMQQVMQHHSSEERRVILFGESLGTGVATEMAMRYRVAALVLQAPFTSVRARAQELYPWAPVRWLLRDRYESLEKITRINAPLLILHGLRDEVIPPAHSQTLMAAASEPKKLILLSDIHHSDFPHDEVADDVHRFYDEHSPR